jgi:hypothetical protein
MTSKKIFAHLARTFVAASLSFVSAHAISGPNQVPFKATVKTSESLVVDETACPGTPNWAGMTVGKGTASHMGKIAFVATDCVAPSGYSLTFTGGKLAITAANGDKLYINYFGLFMPSGTFSASKLPIFALHKEGSAFSIVGGTGRFANATGSGLMSGQEEVSADWDIPSTGQMQLDGYISF